MKKLLVGLLLILTYVLNSSISYANSAESKIIIMQDEKLIETGKTALLDKHTIIVPVDVIKDYIYDNITLDVANSKMNVNIILPKFRLETEKLDESIYSGVDLSFPVKKLAGKSYINLYGLEKVLGIKVINQEKTKTLVIQTGNNSFFSPLQLNQPRENRLVTGKINLVWDHVMSVPRNLAQEDKIEGLDVISPTWFSLADEDGAIANKADLKYVMDAHAKGYKVWALVNNSFDKDMTRKLLNNEWAKLNFIKQLVVYSSLYDLDGINIDFENMYDEDKDKFTQFVRELTTALKEQNIVVSIDITIPSQTSFWSACYDRHEIGKIVDYAMVMTYDEHWRASPVSGSVASQEWVDKGIAATLRSIPKEKLLMGIPFYTREWEETKEDGRIKVKSKTLSMAQAEQTIKDNQLKPVWLKDKGQHYVEYKKDGKLYRIWLEDEKSVALKASLVHKYGLAGAAAWRKDFEQPFIWDVLNTTLKKHNTK